MKKSISLLLVGLMLCGALAGCGGSNDSYGADGAAQADNGGEASGVSGAITVISREDGSGTRGAFVELTGVEEKNDAGEKVDNTTAEAEIANKTDVVLTSVAGNESAIGYVSLGALNETVLPWPLWEWSWLIFTVIPRFLYGLCWPRAYLLVWRLAGSMVSS